MTLKYVLLSYILPNSRELEGSGEGEVFPTTRSGCDAVRRVEPWRANMLRRQPRNPGKDQDPMTEAGSQDEPDPGHDTEGRDPVRRIPDIISLVKDSYSELRPAERRVADIVLDDVKYAVDASNAALAQRAGVSEPTVTRFCRAIGCEGVRDFKLKLAQSLVVGALYLAKSPTVSNDNGMPFWNAVFGEARRALQEAERQLDPAQLQKAADLIAKARQVTVFGLGGSSSALAQETQYRLFRYGITVSAQCDPYLMRMTASTLKPGDLVIAISATGRTREVIEAVELAKHYRANAIAVTAPDTELARACDVRLTVAVPEYPDTLKPTASRFAFLAAVDLLAVASAYKLDGSARETVRRIKYNAQIHRTGKEMEPLGD